MSTAQKRIDRLYDRCHEAEARADEWAACLDRQVALTHKRQREREKVEGVLIECYAQVDASTRDLITSVLRETKHPWAKRGIGPEDDA